MRVRWLIPAVATLLAACETEQSGPVSNVKPVATIRVTPAIIAVEVGDSVQIRAEPRTASGELRLDAVVTWVATDTSALLVRATQQSAWIKVKAAKAAQVEVRSEGKTANAEITGFITTPPNPTPEVSALQPNYADAGAAQATITVTGLGFTAASVVSVNGSARVTSFVDANRLDVTLTGVDLAFPGTSQITVSTPAPGGGISAGRAFTIYGPAVTVTVESPPTKGFLWVGETVRLRAVARDIHGRELAHRKVRWQSYNPATASIDSTGRLTPLKRGATQVNGWVDDRFGFTNIAVMDLPEYDLMYESSRAGVSELWRVTPGPNAAPQRVLPAGTVAMDPAVARDGRIAFVGMAGNNTEIFVADANGTNARRLTVDDSVDDQPSWSPDGTRIVFRSRRSGYSDIWIMNADGSAQRNLTGGNIRVGRPSAQHPTWSPDGLRILFDLADEGVEPSASHVYQVSPNGGAVRQLTTNVNARFYTPELSPDGNIMLVHRFAAGLQDHIWYVGPDGTDNRGMGTWLGAGNAPTWAPNGNWIAYYWDEQSNGSSHVIVSDLFYRKPITLDLGGGRNPVWVRR
jgi:Tol biopolymer transport system component